MKTLETELITMQTSKKCSDFWLKWYMSKNQFDPYMF